MKVIFFGTPNFAMPVLKSLRRTDYDVLHFKSKTLKEDEVFNEFKKLNPDLCIVAAYGKIIPPRYLSIPKYGFLNIHPSLLPKYRGPSPIQTSILNGDLKTGVTIIILDNEVDHGPILASQELSISDFKFSNHDELAEKLFELGAKLLIETLPKYINGEIKPEPQNHNQATFTKMFSREDGRINWEKPAEAIYNQIRALNPEPGTWTIWNPSTSSGQESKIVNIKAASVRTSASQGKPTLEIEIIQLAGKKETPFREFLNGHKNFDLKDCS